MLGAKLFFLFLFFSRCQRVFSTCDAVVEVVVVILTSRPFIVFVASGRIVAHSDSLQRISTIAYTFVQFSLFVLVVIVGSGFDVDEGIAIPSFF